MEAIKLKATRRSKMGTRIARELRAQGKLPAIIYGHGEAPEAVCLDRHDVEVSLSHGARTLDLELTGAAARQFLIKEVQYDHLDQTPIHLDLVRFDAQERVTVVVGIELRGTPKGASDGGILDQYMADIEVECRVSDIPETLNPFVTDLGLGDSLYVRDLALPPGVTAVPDGDERVATVQAPAAAEASEEGAAGEEQTAQPEVIGRARKDEEEGKASES